MKTEYALHRPVQNSYLVRESDRRRWRELGLVFATVLPLVIALLSYTWIHLEVLEAGYQLTRMERQLANLVEDERRQRMVASRLESPARIERLATERLGLVRPRFEQVLFLELTQVLEMSHPVPSAPDSPKPGAGAPGAPGAPEPASIDSVSPQAGESRAGEPKATGTAVPSRSQGLLVAAHHQERRP